MNKPLTRERLAEIRREAEERYAGNEWAAVTIRDLLGEVDRLRLALAARGVDPEAACAPGAGRFVYRDAEGNWRPSEGRSGP